MNNLKATKRDTVTSGQLKKLRDSGLIPGILYGGKDPNTRISVDKKLIKNIISSESFLSSVLDLELDGNKLKVIPRDVAYNVISDQPIHIDFMRVVPGTKIVLEIPVKFINNSDCPGLKVGGVLNIVRRKVELKCPAENIPEEIIVDLKGLEIGTSIKISSIKLLYKFFQSRPWINGSNLRPNFHPAWDSVFIAPIRLWIDGVFLSSDFDIASGIKL